MPEREPIADDAATQIARNAAREVDYSIEKHEIRILRHGEVIQVEFVPVHPGRIGGGLAVYLAAASGKVLDVVHRQ